MKSLKKNWDLSFGYHKILTGENSEMKMLEQDMLKLAEGDSCAIDEKGREFVLVVLGGECSVSGEGFKFETVGKRRDVFDGPASAVYIPCDTPFTVLALSDVSIAVCKAPASQMKKAVHIKPDDVIVKELGKEGWKRQAHFIVDERTDAELLYIGEAFVGSGQWASYPPHKHDEDKMPAEGILEEIYYFEFDKPEGFGIQKVYTDDGSIDETYTVSNGDIVEIPKGYHPFACAPGYTAYYLWIMAGKNRGFFMSTDAKHKWLNG